MDTTLGQLMERNVLEVFGERDSGRRKSVINELYTENCTSLKKTIRSSVATPSMQRWSKFSKKLQDSLFVWQAPRR